MQKTQHKYTSCTANGQSNLSTRRSLTPCTHLPRPWWVATKLPPKRQKVHFIFILHCRWDVKRKPALAFTPVSLSCKPNRHVDTTHRTNCAKTKPAVHMKKCFSCKPVETDWTLIRDITKIIMSPLHYTSSHILKQLLATTPSMLKWSVSTSNDIHEAPLRQTTRLKYTVNQLFSGAYRGVLLVHLGQ